MFPNLSIPIMDTNNHHQNRLCGKKSAARLAMDNHVIDVRSSVAQVASSKKADFLIKVFYYTNVPSLLQCLVVFRRCDSDGLQNASGFF